MDSSNRKFDQGYIAFDDFLRDRDIRSAIGMKYDEGSLLNVLFNMNNREVTKQTEYHRYEFDRLLDTVTVASAADGVPANSKALTLNAGSHNDSGTTSPFKIGDLLEMSNGAKVRVLIKDTTTPSAHIIIVQLINPGTDSFLANGSIASTVVWKYGNAHADGSGQPTGVVRKPSKLSNYTQILKNNVSIYGSEAADAYVVVTTGSGNKHFYLQQVEDLMTRHMLDVELTFLNGDKAQTAELAANHPDAKAVNIYTTGGLNWYIVKSTYGGISYTNPVFDETQMDRIAKRLNTEQAAKEVEGWLHHDLKIEIDKTLRDMNGNTGVTFTYGAFNGSKELAAQFGFSQYSYGGRTYHLKTWDLLSEPKTAALSYTGAGFFMPTGMYNMPGEQKALRAKQVRYKQSPKENRFMDEWTRDKNVTNNDQFEHNVSTECGLDMGLINQCIKFQLS